MKLNTAPIVAAVTATDLISGASLSGLTGAAAVQPQVRVRSANVMLTNPALGDSVTIFKGASGGSAPSTTVYQGQSISTPVVAELDIALAPGEYLTAVSVNGTVAVTISADITF